MFRRNTKLALFITKQRLYLFFQEVFRHLSGSGLFFYPHYFRKYRLTFIVPQLWDGRAIYVARVYLNCETVVPQL